MAGEYSLNPGDSLGDYKILLALGKGKFGEVYKAENSDLGTRALKIPIGDDSFKRLFNEVAAQAKKLDHPNIVEVYDFKRENQPPFIAMKYVDGPSFGEMQKPLEIGSCLELMKQILNAVGYAHSQGVIHGDIKPNNILYDQRNNLAKITDFGLAKIVQSSIVSLSGSSSGIVGTDLYMAPEVRKGNPITEKSDIYSIGVTWAEMLGREPGDYRSLKDINPSVDMKLEVIINGCLTSENNRWNNIKEVSDALRDYVWEKSLPKINPVKKFFSDLKIDMESAKEMRTGIYALADVNWGYVAPRLFGLAILGAVIFQLGVYPYFINYKNTRKNQLIFRDFNWNQYTFYKDQCNDFIYATFFGADKKPKEDKRILVSNKEDGFPSSLPVVSPDTTWLVYTNLDDGSVIKKPFSGGQATIVVPGQKEKANGIIYQNLHWINKEIIATTRCIMKDWNVYPQNSVKINVKTGEIKPFNN